MKLKSKLIGGVMILFILFIAFLGFNQYKKVNIMNFEAKCIACLELETDILYDRIAGTISEKEYIDEMRDNLQNFKAIKEDVPAEFKEEYEKFLKVKSYYIVNYLEEDEDKEVEDLLDNLIDKFNEVNEEKNINVKKRNEKIDGYIEEFTDK